MTLRRAGPGSAATAGGNDRPFHLGGHALCTPAKPAVIEDSTDRSLSFDELDRRSRQVARVLLDAGCRVGDHIAVMLENCAEYPVVTWAAHRIGLYYTPINVQLQPAEVAWIVDDCGARVVVSSAAQAAAPALPAACPRVERWLMIHGAVKGYEPFEVAVDAADDGPLAEETEGNPMIYSSGTTGRPKGVKRPLSGLPLGITLAGFDPRVADAYSLTGDSVSLVPGPVYHSAGLTRMMISQATGATVVLMRRFDAEAMLALVERHRVTNMIVVPTMLIRLLRLDDSVKARDDLSSLVSVTVGAAACPRPVKQAMIDWWGPIIGESYGGSEGNGMTYLTSEEWLGHIGSVGRPVFGNVHILRDDGSEAHPGETGRIFFSDGRVFEYFNDPDKTASVHDDRGWSTIGDVGHVDDDGYLYITDRAADVVISGGVNIYPREVEDHLLSHPDVDDVAVIGVPNEEFGEEVKAIVKQRPGAVPDEDLARSLREFCRAAMAHYKCPKSVDFVDQLPRQANGKLYKRLLREQYRQAVTEQV